MGCYTYEIPCDKGKGEWGTCYIHFSETEDFPCLCTFPGNDEIEGKVDGETVLSLALLGTAVMLAYQGRLLEGYQYIPECIPQWIMKELRRHIII